MSRWAATSTTRWRGPAGVSTMPSGWKSRTALLSGIGTWSWAWKLHRRGELLAVGHGGSSSVRMHRALVGDADAHALARGRCPCEQLAQRVAERALVDDLALAHDVGGSGSDGGALGDDRAVDARLHGRDEARLDVQADDVGAASGGRALRFSESGSLHWRLGECWRVAHAADRRRDAGLSARRRAGACRRRGRLVQEVVRRTGRRCACPANTADERAEREEGAERDRRLASLPRALAGDHDGADEHAREQRDQDRRGDGAARGTGPSRAASLTSPMPMPPG